MRDAAFLSGRLASAACCLLMPLAPALGQPGGALEIPGAEHVNFAYAQVLRVQAVYAEVEVPRAVEYCENYDRVERNGPRSAGGTVLGALIGGAIGNQIGSGSGRRAATVAGAVAGGAIGHAAGSETRISNEQRCHLVEEYVVETQVTGYDVEYRYRGEVYMSRLDFDPGDRLRIRVSVSPAIHADGYPGSSGVMSPN
ncbi:MAG: glycine zipper 2TM domain-containing protein [Xanthomonadales bacterium]|nr:glycine zipper 2TM domain-containing protein [Xanthomonadales bacterium]